MLPRGSEPRPEFRTRRDVLALESPTQQPAGAAGETDEFTAEELAAILGAGITLDDAIRAIEPTIPDPLAF